MISFAYAAQLHVAIPFWKRCSQYAN